MTAPSKAGATKTASVLIALTVMVSAVTVGVVAQPDSPETNSSDEDAEPNDTMANATPIAYGSEINGTLSSPDDVDYYAVNATAGCAILPRLHLRSVFEGSGIQVDVVSPTGEVTTELTNDLMSGPQNDVGAADALSEADVAYTGDVMESDGTYYVRVMEATNLPTGGPQTGASDTYQYSLTVNRTAVDTYEPNENGSTATPVTVGETLTATFAGYDSDVYALNVTVGESYTVNVSHPDDLGPDHATKVLYVYANRSQAADDPAWPHTEDGKSPYYRDSNGSTVATSGTIRDDPMTAEFTAETNGTYYLQLVQDSQNYNLLALDEYELTVNGDDEPNDDLANATPIAYGENVTATLSTPNDTDYYAVNATAGASIIPRLHLKNMFEESAIQVDVVSPTGEITTELSNNAMDDDENIAGRGEFVETDTAYTGDVIESDGTYYVRVMQANESKTYANLDQLNNSTTYHYNLTVNTTTLDQYEPNENGTTATALNLGETVNATFTGYDSDVYAVNLTGGQTYTLTTRSPGSRYSYDTYGKIRIYANQSQPVDDPDNLSAYHLHPNGSTVATSTTLHGETESVVFTPPTNGTYYVHLVQSPENARLLESSSYELTVTETGPNDEMANATPIEYEQDVVTTLSAGEENWYAVDGHAGRGLLADVRYLESTPDGSLEIDVLTANGDVVTELPTDSVDNAVDVMESNETYYIRVSESPGAEANESAVYKYELDAETDELDAYEPNENGTAATPVALNETIHALFRGYDSDVYAVNLTAGETYDANVGIESAVGELDVQLVVYDDAADAVDDPASAPNGTPIAHAVGMSFRRENLTFTAAENGTHYLQFVQGTDSPTLFGSLNYDVTVTRNRTTSDADGEQPPGSGDADGDPDTDRLSDDRERELGTSPRVADPNGDGLTSA